MLAASILAAALFATAPASPCQAPANTGTYRFTAVTKDSTAATVGMIMLENINDCLEATILTDKAGPAVIDHLVLSGDVLTGRVRVANHVATITLKFTSSGAVGSIADGTSEWVLAARRTSGNAVNGDA